MKMVKLSIFIAAIIIALAGNLAAQAKLRIANDRFDMGSIPGGVTASHNYWFKATGADTVVIDSMITTCGCTLSPLEKNWIAPGDSMRVEFCWKTGKKPGPTGNYPYIYTNADFEPISRVYMTGTIMKFPEIVPGLRTPSPSIVTSPSFNARMDIGWEAVPDLDMFNDS